MRCDLRVAVALPSLEEVRLGAVVVAGVFGEGATTLIDGDGGKDSTDGCKQSFEMTSMLCPFDGVA